VECGFLTILQNVIELRSLLQVFGGVEEHVDKMLQAVFGPVLVTNSYFFQSSQVSQRLCNFEAFVIPCFSHVETIGILTCETSCLLKKC